MRVGRGRWLSPEVLGKYKSIVFSVSGEMRKGILEKGIFELALAG